jgi:hypothetical protein
VTCFPQILFNNQRTPNPDAGCHRTSKPDIGALVFLRAQLLLPPALLTKRELNMPQRKRSSGGRKYGKAAGKTVKSAMHRKKKGTLRSGKGGKGGKVKSRKQAIAIGLSEARKKGAKVPKKK